jgi:hypothetical protein
MSTKPKWLSGFPKSLGLHDDLQIEKLEAIQKRYGMDDGTFATIIRCCSATRRRFYAQCDSNLKYESQILDDRKRWKALAEFRLRALEQTISRGGPTKISQPQYVALVGGLTAKATRFESVEDAIDYCVSIDRQEGQIVESKGPVMEVEAVIQGVLQDKISQLLAGMQVSPTGPLVDPHAAPPKKIGGWLLTLCVWMTVISPLFSFAGISDLQSDSAIYLALGLIVFSLVSGVFLWRGSSVGLVLTKTFLFVIIGLVSIGTISAVSNGRPNAVPLAAVQLAVPIAWLVYLFASRRVRDTYRDSL